MKPAEIKFDDWMRILIGEVPPSFFIEVVIRLVVIFLLLIVSMRLLGLRMAAQLNRIEMIALFSLAAAIGVPLQVPDRGLLPAVVIAIVVVLVGRGIAVIAFRNQRFEQMAEDHYTILVKDGVLQMNSLKGTRLTTERLHSELRGQSIRHLGEVKRLYFEAKGAFTLIKEEAPKPGLPVIPDYDKDFLQEQVQTSQPVCRKCGTRQSTGQEAACPNCNSKEWVPAIT